MANNYRGFSTANWIKTRSMTLTGIDLVKRDLLNHIYTIKGERVMMPNFGTRIPLLTFEQNDEETKSIIETDITEVVNYDPRVKLLSLNVVPLRDNNAIVAIVDLLFVEFNVRDTINIEVR